MYSQLTGEGRSVYGFLAKATILALLVLAVIGVVRGFGKSSGSVPRTGYVPPKSAYPSPTTLMPPPPPPRVEVAPPRSTQSSPAMPPPADKPSDNVATERPTPSPETWWPPREQYPRQAPTPPLPPRDTREPGGVSIEVKQDWWAEFQRMRERAADAERAGKHEEKVRPTPAPPPAERHDNPPPSRNRERAKEEQAKQANKRPQEQPGNDKKRTRERANDEHRTKK